MAAVDTSTLRFQPIQTIIDPSFWHDLGALKLDTLRLSEEAQPLTGFYSAANHENIPWYLQFDSLSLRAPAPTRKGLHSVFGEMHNVNTYERFKQLITPERRSALAQAAADRVWADICSGAAEADPALLQRILLLSFADLKIFRFLYWFGFPAIKPPEPFSVERVSSLQDASSAAAAIAAACDAWLSGQALGAASETAHAPAEPDSAAAPAAFWLLLLLSDGGAESYPLSEWQQLGGRGEEVWLAFADHSSDKGSPGWALRNALLLAAARWGVKTLRVAAVRLRRGRACPERSLALSVRLLAIPSGWGEGGVPFAGGWEGNERGRVGARRADLGGAMDPKRLAEAAVDLNLRLMKWRAAPDLDTGRLAAAKCLLLGAGTLGCAVARVLLGWGVRVITLVDNGRVAYSNPVRQSLYEFADCADGGKPKAEAAAAALRRIFPSVQARGVQLCIPMPGHPLSPGEEKQAEADTAQLEALVAEHDAVFLLMDTRESRWLPSLLGAAGNKLVINAALGFDSFLVMRHGAAPDAGEGAAGGSAAASSAAGGGAATARLGCYFCNDVVAPLDSTHDRSLEQQCTVARPGLAGIAGSLAVEMCCGVLQHPAGVRAPAACHDALASSSAGALPLGPVPHMVRGQLGGGFAQHAMVGQAFRQCIACSASVVDAYRAQGWPFVLAALQDPTALEDLTGLTELHSSTALLMMDEDDSKDEAEQSLLAPEGMLSAEVGAVPAGKEEDWLEL